VFSLEESKKNFKINIEWVNGIGSGRYYIFGNIDSIRILQNGTWEDLEREIKRQINIGKEYGRFVISLGRSALPKYQLF